MLFPLTTKDFLDRAVEVYADRVAIIDEPDQPAASWGEITYAELGRRARSQAATLDEMGVPVGGRVAIVSQNSARFFCTLFGVSGWGRVTVPINYRLTATEIRYIVEHSDAEVLLIDPELRQLADTIPCKRIFVFGEDDEKIWASDAEPAPWVGDESATATINYTSGTTAQPKGVQLTHRNLWLHAVLFGWQASVNDRDVYLHTIQAFHGHGWGHPYAATNMGALHIMMRRIDGREILSRIEKYGVTYLCAAPAVVTSILDAARTWGGTPPGRGRVRIIVAGAPPATRIIERIRDELGWEFLQMYGQTETTAMLTLNRMRAEWDHLDPSEQARLLGRAGAPALGVRLRINDDGEVLAQSNHNLLGYWKNPEATAAATADNWLRTGDGGRYEGGYLTISDRKKDMIITGGENVSSIDVENALKSHPAVRDVAVIGIPDDKWGELVTALVVLDEGAVATREDLVEHCRPRLAGYKCPKRIEFRDELPRTVTGKLQKFKLRKEFWSALERQVN
ncbi:MULTISPECIES: AMP-binding protein [Bradyrhizobium]|uniref:Acyl-CoA synthetase (AMP-forming)/AMP-acid ligase II n=2 Tax=Bradyrhizobium TaxID=374 RepID=A0ABY0PEG4_9BRAD|nr:MULTISPECIES: AMP-binding protein [Bradyrhizobium]SDI21321.1 Acyl-CoA synthetase (AMP-forming)/AMP-acid ligase II [Bradyrhizobium ottawaense]SED73434.1 Acyl-CoA synthetase (AMP-forming)/AMP-acid ligase II [Bradyrhizobium lablabi]SHL69317.1 Acyl-CoA synthetase (AMP-forming)/AMP-acid ligase II [Bradyrhizobium lablabi]